MSAPESQNPRVVRVREPLLAAVPPGTVGEDASEVAFLHDVAHTVLQSLWGQFGSGPRPVALKILLTKMELVSEPWKVDELHPPGHCDECHNGNERAKSFLQANPGEYVAVLDVLYDQLWRT